MFTIKYYRPDFIHRAFVPGSHAERCSVRDGYSSLELARQAAEAAFDESKHYTRVELHNELGRLLENGKRSWFGTMVFERAGSELTSV